jgi:hypothetical protein
LHFLPKDVETDDLCSSPQTPSSQLERGYVSISPCPLFKTQTLCVQAAAGVFVVVADFFKPPTAGTRADVGNFEWLLDLLALIMAPS